ncbi:hypothetical protein WIS52_00215 [Pseudonocardia nematodicida]|uniref:Uncharacterized protein n=1 Tax=Pseudonocardia nematodicida TaxID=1206997 RepID=A0ABV1K4Y4_9PSEU
MTNWLRTIVGNRASRIAVMLVALAFLGAFALLESAELVTRGPAVATVGVVLFVLVALPVGLAVGRRADRALGRDHR